MTDILDTVESVVGRAFCAGCSSCDEVDISAKCDEYNKSVVAARLAAARVLEIAFHEEVFLKAVGQARDNIIMLRRGCEAICGKCARPWDEESENRVCPRCGGEFPEDELEKKAFGNLSEKFSYCSECAEAEKNEMVCRCEKAESEAADLRAKLSTAKATGRREMAREVLATFPNSIHDCPTLKKWLEDQAKGGA